MSKELAERVLEDEKLYVESAKKSKAKATTTTATKKANRTDANHFADPKPSQVQTDLSEPTFFEIEKNKLKPEKIPKTAIGDVFDETKHTFDASKHVLIDLDGDGAAQGPADKKRKRDEKDPESRKKRRRIYGEKPHEKVNNDMDEENNEFEASDSNSYSESDGEDDENETKEKSKKTGNVICLDSESDREYEDEEVDSVLVARDQDEVMSVLKSTGVRHVQNNQQIVGESEVQRRKANLLRQQAQLEEYRKRVGDPGVGTARGYVPVASLPSAPISGENQVDRQRAYQQRIHQLHMQKFRHERDPTQFASDVANLQARAQALLSKTENKTQSQQIRDPQQILRVPSEDVQQNMRRVKLASEQRKIQNQLRTKQYLQRQQQPLADMEYLEQLQKQSEQISAEVAKNLPANVPGTTPIYPSYPSYPYPPQLPSAPTLSNFPNSAPVYISMTPDQEQQAAQQQQQYQQQQQQYDQQCLQYQPLQQEHSLREQLASTQLQRHTPAQLQQLQQRHAQIQQQQQQQQQRQQYRQSRQQSQQPEKQETNDVIELD